MADWRSLYARLAQPEVSPSVLTEAIRDAHAAMEAAVTRAGVTAVDDTLSLISTSRAAARSKGVERPPQFPAAVTFRNRIGHRTATFSTAEALAAIRLYERAWCALEGVEPVDAPDLPLPDIGENAARLLALGPWIPLGSVGEGGFGEVLKCHHVDDPERLAAVKVLHHHFAVKRSLARRFAHERSVLRTLGGGQDPIPPSIVRYLGSDAEEEALAPEWLALEFVEGNTLTTALSTARTPWGDPLEHQADRMELAREVGLQLAEGAGYAHGLGLAHRDIKPSNIMLCPDGRVVLLDFGIAADARSAALTRTGAFSPHSPGYAPPEVAMSREPVPGGMAARVDVYSLGVVLLEIVTGAVPDPGTGAQPLLARLPHPGLRDLLSRMVEPRADHRPDMITVQRELRQLTPDTTGGGSRIFGRPGPTWTDPEDQPHRPAATQIPADTEDRAVAPPTEPPFTGSPLPDAPPAEPPIDGEPRRPWLPLAAAIGAVVLVLLAGLQRTSPPEKPPAEAPIPAMIAPDPPPDPEPEPAPEPEAAPSEAVPPPAASPGPRPTSSSDGVAILDVELEPQPEPEPEPEPIAELPFPPATGAALETLARDGSREELQRLLAHLEADPAYLSALGQPATFELLTQSMVRFPRALYPGDGASDAVIAQLPDDTLSCRDAKIWLSWTYDDVGRSADAEAFYARHCTKCTAEHPQLLGVSAKDCAMEPDYVMRNGRCIHRHNVYYTSPCSP